MNLLVLADIHGHLDYLPVIEPVVGDCEGIILAGDITDFGGGEQGRSIIATLSAFGKPLLAVPGNCDLPPVVKELEKQRVSLHGNRIECGGLQFVGVGGSVPTGSSAGAEAGEDVFREALAKSVSGLGRADNLVLVSHQPAWGVRLDLRGAVRHTGSRAVREFIEKYQPILAVSGHVHEGYGIDHLGETVLLNPGPFRRGRYAVAVINGRDVQVELYS